MDEFPPNLLNGMPSCPGKGKTTHKLLDDYDDNRSEAGDQKISRFQRSFLAQMLDGTSFLKKPGNVKSTFRRVKLEKKYTFQTMRKLMFEFNRFLEFCNSYKQKEMRFNMNMMRGEVKTLLRKTSKEASKEVNQRMQSRFDLVPNLYQVSHLRQMVKEMLGQNVYKDFTYLEYLCLLVFVIHSESNCRIGALLNLTFEEYKTMEEKKVLTTYEHKTGAKFPNFVRMTEQNRKWLDDLHQYFREENNGLEPKLAFPSTTNKKFTCQAKYVKEALYKFFRIDDKRYNPDNIRKAWDTFFEKSQFVQGQNALLYQMNTGHCEATRRKYYLKPATDEEIEKLLDTQLQIIDDPESCYMAEDDTMTQEPKHKQQNFERENDKVDDIAKGEGAQSQEEDMEGDALTPPEEDLNNNSTGDDQDDFSGDGASSKNPSDQEDDDYMPLATFKINEAPQKLLKTREVDALKWEAIRLKLFKFKGPEDPMKTFLEEIFQKIVGARFYSGRDQVRDLCQLMPLNEGDRTKLIDKACKKLSNVMSNLKY